MRCMKFRMHTFLPVAAFAMAWLWGGCSTAGTTAASSAAAESPRPTLQQGMSAEEVVAILGEPNAKTKDSDGDGRVEVWVYLRPINTSVRQVAASMASVPWVDPVTGELRYISEPVIGMQRTEFVEELRLRLDDGRLMTIQREVIRNVLYSG